MAGEPSRNKKNDNEVSDRQPLLSTGTTSNDTKQRKDKFPATRRHSESTIDNFNHNNSYGSIGESSTIRQQHQQRQQLGVWRIRIYIMLILLFGIVFVVSLILLIMAPKFAQKTFEDNVQLEFQETSIQNVSTTVDGVNIISMHVTGSITLLGSAYSLGQKITSIFGDIQLLDTTLQVFSSPPTIISSSNILRYHYHLENQVTSPMGTIHLPSLILDSKSNVTHFDFVTPFVVNDPSALVDFCKDALISKWVGWRILGLLPIHIGWIPMKNNLALDKLVDIEGMDGLKQTEMKNMIFPGSHPLGGIVLDGTVGIYNPSKTLSMMIGDVDFGIYLPDDRLNGNDEMIAVVTAKDTRLLGQRMNYFQIHGRTLPLNDSDTHKRRLMEHFLTSYLHGNTSMVRVRGNTFGPDDPNNMANKLPDWLQKALASLTLTVPFQGTTHSDIIQSLTMDHIKIDFSMVTREPLVSGDATALLQLPREMQLSLDVTEIDPDVYIYLEKDSQEPFAQISPTTPCASKTIHRSEDNTIPEDMFMVKSRINRAPFKVLNGHENEFEKFLDRLYHQRNSTVYLQGTANAKVESDLGKLMVHDLKFKGQINTIGMQGMKNPPPKVTSMTIEKGYPDALQFKTRIIITNPSDIDINMGPITFVLSYNQIEIGNVTIENLNLLHGANNEFDAIGYISSEPTKHHDICWKQEVQLPSIVEFIGSYISGRVTHLKIFGKTGSTKSKYLESLMKRLEFMIQVPKFNKRPLLQDVQMNLLSSTVIFWLRNPFEDIDMRIMNINGSASYQVQKIGTMYANFMKEPLALPPVWCEQDECTGFVVQSPKIPVTMKKLGLEAISKALGGKIVIGVDSIVTVMIDSFLLTGLEYKRENITAIIKKTF